MFDRLFTSLHKRWFGLVERLSLEPRRIASPDRAILEEVILPYFGQGVDFQRILFVGCSAYTQWYDTFFPDKEYWTIDSQARKRKYGARQHIVGSITELGRHFPPVFFQAIIMNGVIGFGLDTVEEIERALEACFETLDHGGILVVGWNDHAQRTPIKLDALHALQHFAPYRFEPLQTNQLRTAGWQRHTFSFYRKA